MSLAFNGTSSKLEFSGPVVSGYPFSIFCWIKPANNTAAMMAAAVGDFGGTDEFALYADGTSVGKNVRAFSRISTTSVAGNSATAFSANAWQPALVVFESATSRRCYLATGEATAETTANAPNFSNFDRFVIGCRAIADTVWFSGSLAHCAIWNRALIRADFELLAKGMRPDKVSTDNLIEYWSLDTQAATQTGVKGRVLTASNTSGGADAPTIVNQAVYPTIEGVWTWYNDPRAVEYAGSLYVGYVNKAGSIGVQKLNLVTLKAENFILANQIEIDDHDNPGIIIMDDGRIACFYTKHNDPTLRYKISTNPGDISSFGPQQTFTGTRSLVTYAIPTRLTDSVNKYWNFYRDGEGGLLPSGLGFRSSSDMVTWTNAAVLYENGSVTPYYKVVSNGIDEIHFCVTDRHPVQGQSSLYHFYLKVDGSGTPKYYKSDGTQITASLPFGPSDITKVYDGATTKGWNWQIAIDPTNRPRILGTRYPGNDGSDIRYMHWRWDGSAWVESEITTDGPGLFAPEVYYAGGICFDGNDINAVYLSKPVAGVREIQKWQSSDNGATWAKTEDITTGTPAGVLNARPFSPKGWTRAPMVYWSGSYSNYVTYNTNVMVKMNAAIDAFTGTGSIQTNVSGTGSISSAGSTGLSGIGSTQANSSSTGAIGLPAGVSLAGANSVQTNASSTDGITTIAIVKSISTTLVNVSGIPLSNLTGLKWAFFEQSNVSLLSAPNASGLSGQTDANGLFTVEVATLLPIGSVGWLIITNSDGSLATNHKSYAGPVVVS